ncbi:MAG TPA: PqiC family protein [Alphaproteobacteria bacterium]|nr:PqiC family protein [Alphaproteobacteria bacterium]
MNRTIISLSLFLGLASGLGGCTPGPSAPTHYYVLTATAPADPAAPRGSVGTGPSVELARVALAEYLNQPNIVTRVQTNEVQRAENDLWAGPLADDITRTVGENLSLMLPTDHLSVSGSGQASSASYTVEVEIVRFDRDAQNVVHLIARWAVTRNDGRKLVAMRRSSFEQSSSGDYAGTVAAMSRALSDLCAEIANAIKRG